VEAPADCEAAAWLRYRFTTWLLVLPYLFMNYGLSLLIVDRKASLFMWPSYTKREKRLLAILMVILAGSWVYSIFLPLKLGTAWFYAGLPIYLLGLIFVTMAVLSFATAPVGKPNTTSIHRVSRHPMNFGWFLIFLGTGIASASWVYLFVALAFLSLYNTLAIPEEGFCLEKYGDAYREYMNRTSRWIGITKSA